MYFVVHEDEGKGDIHFFLCVEKCNLYFCIILSEEDDLPEATLSL